MKTLDVGSNIPNFTLTDQYGRKFNVIDHVGNKKLVIYFYPKDESGVCTAEACAFRDSFTEFSDEGAMVIGINAGSVASHKAFSDKNNLPFTLLSDPDNVVLKRFGIKPWLFLTGRETFIIGQDGRIAFRFRAFLDGKGHAKNVLDYLSNKK